MEWMAVEGYARTTTNDGKSLILGEDSRRIKGGWRLLNVLDKTK